MIGFVQIHADAHIVKRWIGLRRPGASGLPVGDRRCTKDPLHVACALRFTAIELGAAILPPGILKIDGDGRLLTVGVAVVSEIVLLERGDDIGASARFEHARLFPNNLERRSHAQPRQHLRQPLRRIIVLRQDVILGVEPERDVDRHRLLPNDDSCGYDDQQQENESVSFRGHL